MINQEMANKLTDLGFEKFSNSYYLKAVFTSYISIMWVQFDPDVIEVGGVNGVVEVCNWEEMSFEISKQLKVTKMMLLKGESELTSDVLNDNLLFINEKIIQLERLRK